MCLHTNFYKLSCIVHMWSLEYQRLPWNDFGNSYYMHTIYEELQISRDLNPKKKGKKNSWHSSIWSSWLFLQNESFT